MFNNKHILTYCINFKNAMRSVPALVIAFLMLLSTSSFAQSIAAQVSTRKVQAGVPFEFAVVISGSPSNYNQPYFKDFEVVSGPNQSNSVQMINGVVSQQLVFSYVLVAKREGKLTIPSANCVVNGQKMETQAIVIDVAKGNQSGVQSGSSSEDYFIKTTISKNKFYVGEPVTITQKIYSRHQLLNVPPKDYSYDGFYSQSIDNYPNSGLQMENIGGINYYSFEFSRSLSTANKAGKMQLSPIEAKIAVRRQATRGPRNIWEQLLGAGYEDVAVEVKSRALSIEVMPLPEAGRPESFNGAVGNLSAKVEISKNEIKANDAITLKYTVSGKGNVKLLDNPKIIFPETFETYEPKISEGPNSKTFEYLIIPRTEGDYEISGLDFCYFNLDSKSYVVTANAPIKVHVLPGAPGSEGAQVYTPHSQIKTAENDIRYIKKGNYNLSKADTEFFNSFWHIVLLAFSPLALIAGLIARAKYLKNNADISSVRQRKAAGIAKQRLTAAEKMMKAGKKDEFYTEVLLALNNYLSFRFTIPVAELSKESVIEEMTRKNISTQVQEKVLTTLQSGEYAKYAPGALSGDLQAVYNDTVELVTEIENQLNKKQA